MGYIRLDEQPGEVYHYTHRKNLDSILRDGRIRRMGDRECWFCASLEDTLTLMRATVMMEGKPYYKVGGSIGRYPKFVPEDYVILRLNPRFQKGEWVQWMQEMCALPGFVDSKNEEKTERNAGYLVVSHSGGGMLRQGTRKGIRRTPANRGMRAHWVVKGLDISEDVCHGMCP